MSTHPENQLHDFFFDRLESDARARVDAHVRDCASCTRRLEAFDVAVQQVPAAMPGTNLHDRLFQSLEHLERFAPFARQLGALIEVSDNDARRVLHGFADVDSWPLRPLPGMRAAPLTRGTQRGILACFEPSAQVPHHRHLGRETILVFQGAFEIDTGKVIRAGEELRSEPGTAHAITRILDDIPCLCVILNPDRIEYEEPPAAGEAL